MDAVDKDGQTPLHLAVSYHYVKIILILLERGANRKAADHAGTTPLKVAKRGGSQKRAGLLHSHKVRK